MCVNAGWISGEDREGSETVSVGNRRDGSWAVQWEVLQLCSHAVIGWLGARSGLLGLRSIQMASI